MTSIRKEKKMQKAWSYKHHQVHNPQIRKKDIKARVRKKEGYVFITTIVPTEILYKTWRVKALPANPTVQDYKEWYASLLKSTSETFKVPPMVLSEQDSQILNDDLITPPEANNELKTGLDNYYNWIMSNKIT